MKKIVALLGIGVLFAACDKVEKPIVPGISSELNQSLYPGAWQDYLDNDWPTFTANSNTDRNILLEDYTGHQCTFCPLAATEASNIETANPGRVFVASIHASPDPVTGVGNFQETDGGTFVHDFTNNASIAYGSAFASGFGFSGNPRGTVNRFSFDGSDPALIFSTAGSWSSNVSTMLGANDLKVNIQTELNYYAATKGLFVHTEVEELEALSNELAVVTYFIENDFVSPQKDQSGTISDYHHHNTMRAVIDNRPWGRTLTEDELDDSNGKYYFDYSYEVPSQYDVTNCHLLIYVYDKTTYEVYQVIKKEIM